MLRNMSHTNIIILYVENIYTFIIISMHSQIQFQVYLIRIVNEKRFRLWFDAAVQSNVSARYI